MPLKNPEASQSDREREFRICGNFGGCYKKSRRVTIRWLKIKNPHYTQTEGRHEMFTAFHERRKSSSKIS
jgi:hypothetical protein